MNEIIDWLERHPIVALLALILLGAAKVCEWLWMWGFADKPKEKSEYQKTLDKRKWR